MKWTKFKDQIPPNEINHIWITDYKQIWIHSLNEIKCWLREIQSYDADSINKALWAEIPTPETPIEKKEPHKCEGIQGAFSYNIKGQWICEEREGKLSYFESFDDNMTYSEVNFCPFCGYSNKINE